MERAEELRHVEPAIVPAPGSQDGETARLVHQIHRTIKKVTEDIARFHLNTAIAAIMELVNAVYKFVELGRKDDESLRILRGALDRVILLVAPFCPHIGEELWEALGHTDMVANQPWPSFDEAYAREERVTIAVQVNGKLRDTVEVDRGIDEAALKELVLSQEKVQRHLTDRQIRKIIVVPNKLVNIVL